MTDSDYKKDYILSAYRKKPIGSEFIVFPAILNILENLKGKKVLDLGCGQGNFSRQMAKKGASVIAADLSPKWIKICKKENSDLKRVSCIVADGANLKHFKRGTFDFVVINLVFLSIPSKKKVKKIFKEVSRVLKKSGKLIFSDLHPLCLRKKRSHTEQRIFSPGFSYFKNGDKFKSRFTLSDYSTLMVTDYHWTLQFYTEALEQAGMYIYRIIEPRPIHSAPKLFNNYHEPEHLIFKCKKL